MMFEAREKNNKHEYKSGISSVVAFALSNVKAIDPAEEN